MTRGSPLSIEDLQEAIDIVTKYGSIRKAAKFTGIPRSTLNDRYQEAKANGLSSNEDPDIPEDHNVQATSILYGPEGKPKLIWVKSNQDKQKTKQIQEEAIKSLSEKLPKLDPIKYNNKNPDENLMTCFPVGDHHLGLLVWGEETRTEDYDLEIGERLLLSAYSHLLGFSKSKYATLVFLGDFLHYDSFETVTPTNRNQLDSDTRFTRMVRVAIRSMRQMIESAARTHEKVHVIIEIGNHDIVSSIWFMEALANIYEKEPRITIDRHPGYFHYFRHGKCLVGVHHGHGAKGKLHNLPLIMAADQPRDWGETDYRYIWTGHIHQDKCLDIQGVKVESFRVLPPADAWATNNGYRSMSEMKSVTLHKDFGEVGRFTVNPAMLN